jgi:hypothetical protein
MSQAEITASEVLYQQSIVDGLRGHINTMYAEINAGLAASGGVITKEIDNKYKEIDAAFNRKTKHEQNVASLKRRILTELGIA